MRPNNDACVFMTRWSGGDQIGCYRERNHVDIYICVCVCCMHTCVRYGNTDNVQVGDDNGQVKA